MSTLPQQTPNQETARQYRAQAVKRFNDGDMVGATRILTQAIQLDPAPAEGHYLMGNCLRRLRSAEGAELAFKAALERDPGLAAAWFGLAFLYEENGRLQETADWLRRLATQFAAEPDVLHKAGGLMGDFGLYADAAALYEGILKREPQARNHLRLGQYQQKLGRYTEALHSLTAAIDLNPDAGPAYLLLANSHRFSRSAEDQALLKRFTQVLEAGTPSRITRICLHFALGKIHDDLDEFDTAFRHFSSGNSLRREEVEPFVPAQWRDVVRQMEESYSAPIVPRQLAVPGPAPIFVVGMLRSGTTLTERILASHPQVTGLGETPWLESTVGRAIEETGTPYPACIARITDEVAAILREDYTRHWPKDGAAPRYFVDKNPLNFIYLGFIARLFPDARIVHCARDARDASLSTYFQNFAHPEINFAYSLEDIAYFHNGYMRGMSHWEKTLPSGMLHHLKYEELVADQEQVTRTLLTALDLPWDAACLKFEMQPDSIATASVWQARQPLYARSVGRWRQYERHLAPLLQILAD